MNDTANAFTKTCSIIDNVSSQELHSVGQTGPIHPIASGAARDEQNPHSKLRRQLSVNPNGCDARLFRRQNAIKNKPLSANTNQMQSHQPPQQQLLSVNLNNGHRTLTQAHSGPRMHNTNHWDLHKVKINELSNDFAIFF